VGQTDNLLFLDAVHFSYYHLITFDNALNNLVNSSQYLE